MSRPHSQGARSLVTLLLLVPGLAALSFIARFGVNCLYLDEWLGVPYLQDFYAHRLTLARLFEQHNEHRIFFPRLLFVYLGTATGYDTRLFMYLSWSCLALAMLCLARLHLRFYGSSTRSLALLLPVAVLLFHLRQADNLLWGWQLQITLSMALFYAAVTLLIDERPSAARTTGALVCLLVGTFSFGSGLVAWPALVLLVLYQRAFLAADAAVRRALGLRALLLLAAMLLSTALYFHGYAKPADHPSETFVVHHPLEGLTALCAVVGAFAGNTIPECVAVGAFFLAFAVVVVAFAVRGWVDRRRFALVVPLLAFGLGSAAMVAASRGGMGMWATVASRYVTLVVPALLALHYGALASTPGLRGRALSRALLAVLLVCVISGDSKVFEVARYMEAQLERGRDVVRNPRQYTPRDAKNFCPWTQLIPPYSRFLAQHHLNVFAE